MDKYKKMELKPLEHQLSQNPFTKVNGNNTNFSYFLLPSASCPSGRRVADGFDKLL
jgi:hypothetical protein